MHTSTYNKMSTESLLHKTYHVRYMIKDMRILKLIYSLLPSLLALDSQLNRSLCFHLSFTFLPVLNVQVPFTWDQYDKAYQSLLCHESQYPAEVVMKMKEDRKSFGNKIYLREFSSF